MSILGSLRDASLAEVIQFLRQQTKSGTLRAWTHDRKVSIVLHRGEIVGASGPKTRRLGHILTDAGVIDTACLGRAVAQQTTEHPPRPLGQILVAMGVVTEAQVARAVEAQVVATVADVVTWDSGQFEFVPHAIKPVDYITVAPGKVFPRVAVDAEAALLEALRRVDERAAARSAGAPADPVAPVEEVSVAAVGRAAGPARAGGASPAGGERRRIAGRDIGFYDSVELDGRVYHVQTEVVGRREPVIRTTVLDGGAVVLAERQAYPAGEDDVDVVRDIIERHHRRLVIKVGRGEFERG